MDPVSQTITLLSAAIQACAEPTKSKAAYKELQKVCDLMRNKPLGHEASVLTEIEKLLALEKQIHELKNKYKDKIQLELKSIRVQKCLIEAQTKLNPHCTQFLFAGENPDDPQYQPYFMPLQTMELLRDRSAFFKANRDSFKKEVIQLHDIDRKIFFTILEHLAQTSITDIENHAELLKAVDFLGIPHLQATYSKLLCEDLTSMSWEEVANMVCEVAIGEIPGKAVKESILLAFMELECRYAFNRNYFETPDIESKCTAISGFWEKAAIHAPELSIYLANKKAETTEWQLDPTASVYQQVGCALAYLRNHTPDPEKHFIVNIGTPNITAYLASCLGHSHDVPKELTPDYLRAHPVYWFKKIKEELAKASSPAEFENILKEIDTFRKECVRDLTLESVHVCNAMSFVCFVKLGRFDQAEQYVECEFFEYCHLREGQHELYLAFLAEKGCFERIRAEASPFPWWLHEMFALYNLDIASCETWRPGVFKDMANILQNQHTTDNTIEYKGITTTFSFKPSTAIEDLSRHCAQNPKDLLPRILLAQLYFKKGADEEAIQMCSQILEQHKIPEIVYRRYLLYRKKGNTQKALEDARLFSQLNGHRFVDMYNLFKLGESVGQLIQKSSLIEELKCLKIVGLLKGNKVNEADALLNTLKDQKHYATNFTRFLRNPSLINIKAVIFDFDAPVQFRQEVFTCFAKSISYFSKFDAEIMLNSYKKLWSHPHMQNDDDSILRFWKTLLDLLEMKKNSSIELKGPFFSLEVFSALNGDPADLNRRLEKVNAHPECTHAARIMIQVYQAHRLGNDDEVLRLTNNSDDMLFLRADSLRRKGNFVEALAICEQHTACRFQVIKAAIKQIEMPSLDMQFQNKVVHAYLRGDSYYYFLELAQITLAKSYLSDQNLQGAKDSLDIIEKNFVLSAETLQFMQSHGRMRDVNLAEFARRGYDCSIFNGPLHTRLAREGKFGSMDANFLASSPEHAGIYGQYLYFMNDFAKALQYLSPETDASKIADCHEHLNEEEKANEHAGEYLKASKLYSEGKYEELTLNYDRPLNWRRMETKGLYTHFLVAKSYFKQRDLFRAGEAIRLIQNQAKTQADRYGRAFFTKIASWEKKHLGGPHKKIRGRE